MIKTFKRIGMAWAAFKTILYFGPDLTTQVSRDQSLDDIAREARRQWAQMGFHLLPHQYRRILDRLSDEGLITEITRVRCASYAETTIIGPGLEYAAKGTGVESSLLPISVRFPWVDDPTVLRDASPGLRERVGEFETDHAKFLASAKGAFVLLSIP